jgi:transposase InsO family protein
VAQDDRGAQRADPVDVADGRARCQDGVDDALVDGDELAVEVTDLGMVQSVGRTGLCWDNSVAESLWSSLKREVVHRYRFPDRATARRAIFAWINTYNHRRVHSSLGYIPPVEWEHQYRQPEADLAASPT